MPAAPISPTLVPLTELVDLTDDELSAKLNAILAEQERRQRVATIPATIATLREQFVEGGGDPALLDV